MSPRIEHSELALVRLAQSPTLRTLGIVTSPAGTHYIKKIGLGKNPQPYSLISLNDAFAPITNVLDWQFRGEVTAILKMNAEPGEPNIEWNFGRPLRA